MTENMKYYEAIRREYPETISKDQFYRIAHISKATALHLLQNGLVPCKDSGKKTRRYTIRTDDVIFYMIDRELHPEVYHAPDNWYQGRSGHYTSRITYRTELSKLTDEELKAFRKLIEHELKSYGDLLTVVDVVDITGYVLISILSALHEAEFTLDEVQSTLQMLFDKQYILTTEEIVEVRYRTETRVGSYTTTDPETGATNTHYYTYEVEVPYNYYIMNVTLENFNLSHVPVYIMSQDQLSMYATYMSVVGNREDLFPSSS